MECQQEAEAAHPAPAWGRWKWNASMKWKLPLRHCTVGSMPNPRPIPKTYIPTYIHTYIDSYIQTYIHTTVPKVRRNQINV